MIATFPISLSRLHEHENEHGIDASRHNHVLLQSLLPATYRTEPGDLAAARRQVTAFTQNELDLQRLVSIHG